jgi:group I intron endonuclease
LIYHYNGSSNKSGIYEIRNRLTNRSYIGQAKNFKIRWGHHKSSLLRNARYNAYFRNDFNKCYAQLQHTNFIEFYVIEVMENSTKEERNKREDFWIRKARKVYGKANVYNFISSNAVSCYSKTPEQTFEKLSKRPKRFGPNNPMYGKIGILNPRGKFYDIKLQSADGNIHGPIYGLHAFCRTHGLSATKLCAVIKGRRNCHAGWKLVR